MKVFVVLHEMMDDGAEILGVYSSREFAERDWREEIKRMNYEDWEDIEIYEIEFNRKNPSLSDLGEDEK